MGKNEKKLVTIEDLKDFVEKSDFKPIPVGDLMNDIKALSNSFNVLEQ